MARLVSTERLAWHLNDHDLALIDVRWEPDAPQAGINAYRSGHIPGAVFLDLDVDLSDRSDLSRGRHPLPSPERFAATLARAGIGQDARVVAYDDKAGSFRLHGCRRCRRYLKEVRSDVPVDQFSFLQTALGTVRLDFAAQEEGFIRESPLTVRYDDPDGNELLLYRQAAGPSDAPSPAAEGASFRLHKWVEM